MFRMILRPPEAIILLRRSRSFATSSPTVRRPFKSRIDTPSRSLSLISRLMNLAAILNRHLDADLGFDVLNGDHLDGIPRASVQERPVRALAGAFLALDAKERIDLDSSEGRMVRIRDPVHAVGYRAIGDTRRRSGAPRAALRDNGQFLGALFARCGNPFGLRL